MIGGRVDQESEGDILEAMELFYPIRDGTTSGYGGVEWSMVVGLSSLSERWKSCLDCPREAWLKTYFDGGYIRSHSRDKIEDLPLQGARQRLRQGSCRASSSRIEDL